MDDGESPVIGLILFLILMAMQGLFVCFATALERANESQLEKLVKEGSKKAVWLKGIIDKPDKTIFSLQILITGISVMIGIFEVRYVSTYIFEHVIGKDLVNEWKPIGYLAAALIFIILLAAFGGIAPQKIALRKADMILLRLAGLIRAVLFLMQPFFYLCNKLSNLLVRLFRIDPNEGPVDVTEDEIKSVVNEGHEQGILKANEAKMIHNIIEFADKDAKEIMTHRKNIVAVDGKTTLKEALDFMLLKNNTRFPVYEEDMDNITGIIHIKDAMILSRNQEQLPKMICEIEGLAREINFIPETRSLNTLFKTMQAQKSQMVIVVDEYGQTAGLVAMEDILEEIVGNILDEYDEDESMIVEEIDGTFLMKGMAPLDEICDILGITTEIDQYETLNGYLISLIDKIPNDHELFELCAEGYLFQVLEVNNKIIQTVKVKKLPETLTEEKQQDTCDEKKYVIE